MICWMLNQIFNGRAINSDNIFGDNETETEMEVMGKTSILENFDTGLI